MQVLRGAIDRIFLHWQIVQNFLRLPLALSSISMHNTLRCVTDMVGVAQLARATGCGPVGRGFESLYPPQFLLRVDIGSLAQLVEQGTLNPKVQGSTP